jgi:endonuclease III
MFRSRARLFPRKICTARKPKCAECKLNTLCPAAFTFDNGK